MNLPEYVKNLLDKVATNEGFTNYNLSFQSDSKVGDNFLGLLIFVTMTGERLVDDKIVQESLHLVTKIPPLSEARVKTFRVLEDFKHEVFMYEKVLPEFTKFQCEKGLAADECFTSYPKVYATVIDEENGHYALVVEDMRPKGFVMCPRTEQNSLENEKLIMKEVGKLHAISYAMKDQQPERFEKCKITDVLYEMLEKGHLKLFIREAITVAKKVIKSEYKSIIDNLFETFQSIMEDSLVKYEEYERFGVINHGDLWQTNVMFQSMFEENRSNKICFLDWQLSRFGSLATDLHYHMMSQLNAKFREENYALLLDIYYDSLTESIKRMGTNPDKCLKYADFKQELKKFGGFGLVTGIYMMIVKTVEECDILDPDEYCEHLLQGTPTNLYNISDKTMEYLRVELNALMKDLIEYGYIDAQR